MTLLCFLLDLPTIPPPLLRDLKQSLLQLANLYAVSFGRRPRDQRDQIPPLPDRLGLCYLQRNKALLSDELRIAYCPRGNFNLRDFHHAVNNLPTDCFLPESGDFYLSGSSYQGVTLSRLLSPEALYSWSGKDVLKKLLFISSALITNNESLRRNLTDAAEQCVSVEFIVLEQDNYHDISENMNLFLNSISDLENCLLRKYVPDTWVLSGLVKRWLQELNNDISEPLQAVFFFRDNIVGSKNQIFCNLFAASNHIIDGFTPCQTCRCHGLPIDGLASGKSKKSSCPITNSTLGDLNVIENAVKVGEQTILFLPSFQGCQMLQQASTPITFHVIERISLASLDEGVILGTPYVVSPAACHEIEIVSDECGNSEINSQLFHGLRVTLSLLDQGLVCSSSCNTETMTNAIFQCFYLLQPSDRGPMLLRRIAASEEVMPVPEASVSDDLSVSEEMVNSIQASLSKMEPKDYIPLLHERGFHMKLNLLVKESLQLGAILEKHVHRKSEHDSDFSVEASSLTQPSTTRARDSGMQTIKQQGTDDDISCVAEEWEQLLIVDEAKENHSTTSICRPKFENLVLSAQSKVVDEKTSRILERLEPPKQQKSSRISPVIPGISAAGVPTKKPLLPFSSNPSSSQPLKPTFQRLKRKLK